MNADEIQIALENAEGIPEAALRAAVREAASLAPAVIAITQRMAGGYMPLPREERLFRFGLHALAVARETSACPVFLALLKLQALELEWLFGEDRIQAVTRLLLGLFDGDDAAVGAVAADPAVDSEVQSALMSALARLVWEGRASRERLLELLDRFDREGPAEPGSLAWLGWQDSILLLGLTDWIERVHSGWDAGRLPWLQRDVDRQDWLEQTREAAAQPDDPARFVERSIVPIDDPVTEIGWSAEPASRPGDPPTSDELAWLEVLLWRRVTKGTMCLEEVDGFLTALAVGPVRIPPAEFLPVISGGSTDLPLFDSPEHDMLAGRPAGPATRRNRGRSAAGKADRAVDQRGRRRSDGRIVGARLHARRFVAPNRMGPVGPKAAGGQASPGADRSADGGNGGGGPGGRDARDPREDRPRAARYRHGHPHVLAAWRIRAVRCGTGTGTRAQGWPQRALPLRVRQEVQAMLWGPGVGIGRE